MRGSVRKRGTQWTVVLDLPRDAATGRRRQKRLSGFATRAEAEQALADVMNKVHRGEYVEASRTCLRDYLVTEWLPAKRSTIKPTTYAGYRRVVDDYIV